MANRTWDVNSTLKYTPIDAVVRGVVEHSDPGRYFGSFGALPFYRDQALEHGLVLRVSRVEGRVVRGWTWVPTKKGQRHYEERGLGKLPQIVWTQWGMGDG